MISKLLRIVRSKQTIVSKETILRRRPLKEVHFDIGRCFSPAVWEFHWLSNERRYNTFDEHPIQHFVPCLGDSNVSKSTSPFICLRLADPLISFYLI